MFDPKGDQPDSSGVTCRLWRNEMTVGNSTAEGSLPVAPIVPVMPIGPTAIMPPSVSPARMPVAPTPTRVPIVPVTPPHRLDVRRRSIALGDFRPRPLTQLLLNLLHPNLQRL